MTRVGDAELYTGDVLAVLAGLPEESVHCVVTSPRDGRFVRGTHWRDPKPFWNREWLAKEYGLGRSAAEIAHDQGCTENNILYWLAKHGISCRTVSQIRALKHWGSDGTANPMYGKRGSLNPNYIDGSSPERQRLYVQAEGRAFLLAIYLRDGYKCVRCHAPKKGPRSIHAHHVKPWAGNPSFRFDFNNAVTLCRRCHSFVHSKANIKREYL